MGKGTTKGAIRALYCNGMTSREIGSRYGVHPGTIRVRAVREKWDVANTRRVLKQRQDEAAKVAADVWADRRETMKEKLHMIGERITDAALKEAPDELLKKAEKVKIAFELGAKGAGIDRETDGAAQVNLLLLSDIGGSPKPARVYEMEGETPRLEDVAG
jgi:hypothetical protein